MADELSDEPVAVGDGQGDSGLACAYYGCDLAIDSADAVGVGVDTDAGSWERWRSHDVLLGL